MGKHTRNTLALLITSLILLAAGCSAIQKDGSGNAQTMSYALDDFDGIDIGGAFELRAVAGQDFSVEVTADDNFIDDLEIEVKGSTLHIGFESGRRNVRTQPVAIVSAPHLDFISISGASVGVVDGIASDSFELELSGASESTITGTADAVSIDASGASNVTLDLRADSVEVDAGGDSESTITGTADAVSIDASGASTVTLDFRADTAKVDASGASSVDLRDATIAEVEVDISGASNLELGTTSTVTGELSGASSLETERGTTISVEATGGSAIDYRG